jgi:hypothetical protein
VSDFQFALKVVAAIFLACAVLAVSVSIVDAWLHLPLADFLVKKFCDIMFVCAGALAGIFQGMQIERRKHKHRD